MQSDNIKQEVQSHECGEGNHFAQNLGPRDLILSGMQFNHHT